MDKGVDTALWGGELHPSRQLTITAGISSVYCAIRAPLRACVPNNQYTPPLFSQPAPIDLTRRGGRSLFSVLVTATGVPAATTWEKHFIVRLGTKTPAPVRLMRCPMNAPCSRIGFSGLPLTPLFPPRFPVRRLPFQLSKGLTDYTFDHDYYGMSTAYSWLE